MYALVRLTNKEDNILGVKVLSAYKGPTILDVLITYKPTITSSQAYNIFKKAIQIIR